MLLARAIAALGILIASTVASFGDEVMLSDVESQNLRPQKVTPLGLYLSSEKANRILAANPGIIFIDVRDPLEVATSGHPAPVDAVVPIKVLSNYFDSRLNEFAMVSNPNFVREVEQLRVSSGRTRDGNETGNELAKRVVKPRLALVSQTRIAFSFRQRIYAVLSGIKCRYGTMIN